MVKCLGIYRELQNSPNRETDDALILQAVMEQLGLQRVETTLLQPEEADAADLSGYDMIVPMCETYPRLKRLEKVDSVIVNPPSSVLGCYRVAMLEAFDGTPGLLYPETEVRKTNAPAAWPAFGRDGLWIKRGDVHNTCSHDVVFAKGPDEFDAIRRDFERREIAELVLQRHVDGDLIKFYGVGPGQWFTWFYHDPSTARRLSFELEDLAAQAEKAAAATRLEVFGGDAIVTPEGPIHVIDINSWPSFARVRREASVQIARRLRARLREREKSR